MNHAQAADIAANLYLIDTTLQAILELLAHPLQSVQCSTETTTHKRTRNEAARCGNCPYYDKGGATEGRDACALTPERLVVWPRFWCGQHPDFWKEEA
jgi:hypothetical protein